MTRKQGPPLDQRGKQARKREIVHPRTQSQKRAGLTSGRPWQGPEGLSLAQPEVGRPGSRFANSFAEGQPCGPGAALLSAPRASCRASGQGTSAFLPRLSASPCHRPCSHPVSSLAGRPAPRAACPALPPATGYSLQEAGSVWAVPYPPSLAGQGPGSRQGCRIRIRR